MVGVSSRRGGESRTEMGMGRFAVVEERGEVGLRRRGGSERVDGFAVVVVCCCVAGGCCVAVVVWWGPVQVGEMRILLMRTSVG